MVNLKRICLLAGLILGLLPQTSRALMIKLGLEDLTRGSDIVTRAKVENIRCSWNEDHTTIFTYATLSINELITGTLTKEKEITVRYPGGEVGKIGLRVSDTPQFKIGEDVVVFLEKEGTTGFRTVYGNFQGKYTIDNGIVLENRIPVQNFISQIKTIAEQLERR